MTTIYSQKNNRRSNKSGSKKIILGLGAFLILLFFFFGKNLSGLSVQALAPAMRIYNRFSETISLSFNFLKPKENLLLENEALKERITELEAKNLKTRALVSEEEVLMQATSSSLLQNAIQALPTSFPPQVPYDTLIIDKGERAGIKTGAKVFLYDRVEAGVVEEVYANFSKIRLFSSPGIKTEAVLERTGEILELTGQGGGSFEASLPASFDIKEEDLVVLPGLPRTIFAKTVSIKKDETSSLNSVFFSPPLKINGNSILYVQI